jgi:hypothetical protein
MTLILIGVGINILYTYDKIGREIAGNLGVSQVGPITSIDENGDVVIQFPINV